MRENQHIDKMSPGSTSESISKKKIGKITKTKKTKTLCISHKEDADGISSAALIKQAFGGDCVLVDYPGLEDALEPLRNDEKLKKLFVCDLGLNKQNSDYFVDLLTDLRKKSISVTYIDHHDLDSKIINKLKKIKVKVIHDITECTAVLTYNTFKKKLTEHSPFIAACAAITDYMEDRPIASELLQMYDRQFALISATVLTYNIVGHQKDVDYLLYLVDELCDSKYPHEIPNTYEFAQIQVKKLAEVLSKVRESMKTAKKIAYMEVHKERVDKGIYAVSVRGSPACKTHLGRLVSSIAANLGGSGGGHNKACGAVIPKEKIKKFLQEMDLKIRN